MSRLEKFLYSIAEKRNLLLTSDVFSAIIISRFKKVLRLSVLMSVSSDSKLGGIAQLGARLNRLHTPLSLTRQLNNVNKALFQYLGV